ncbi:hypothetical protein GE09DRAFT_169690 [Coniochaeta sp. 2T2.1]|nr:hypothetical protein GE09DRAFT_169690 [Coniochaeta sp. 2T2.1]
MVPGLSRPDLKASPMDRLCTTLTGVQDCNGLQRPSHFDATLRVTWRLGGLHPSKAPKLLFGQHHASVSKAYVVFESDEAIPLPAIRLMNTPQGKPDRPVNAWAPHVWEFESVLLSDGAGDLNNMSMPGGAINDTARQYIRMLANKDIPSASSYSTRSTKFAILLTVPYLAHGMPSQPSIALSKVRAYIPAKLTDCKSSSEKEVFQTFSPPHTPKQVISMQIHATKPGRRLP